MTPVSPSPARALSLVARYNWLSSVVLDYDKSTGREGGWLGYCSRGSHRPGVSCTAELGVDSSGINVIPLTDWPACSMSWAPAGQSVNGMTLMPELSTPSSAVQLTPGRWEPREQ